MRAFDASFPAISGVYRSFVHFARRMRRRPGSDASGNDLDPGGDRFAEPKRKRHAKRGASL
jgi:hypothetical protein